MIWNSHGDLGAEVIGSSGEALAVAVEKWLEIVDLTASQVLRLLDGVFVSLRPELTNLDRYFH